jgi:hypothetical protein
MSSTPGPVCDCGQRVWRSADRPDHPARRRATRRYRLCHRYDRGCCARTRRVARCARGTGSCLSSLSNQSVSRAAAPARPRPAAHACPHIRMLRCSPVHYLERYPIRPTMDAMLVRRPFVLRRTHNGRAVITMLGSHLVCRREARRPLLRQMEFAGT